tara:strand:+ start:53 stop:694 length:642 start_codon:yes stop_codon:yes gene_type:complete
MDLIASDRIIEHFTNVIQCTQCTELTSAKLLRDTAENIPQPGWVGSNYSEHRVLLVGQNPGVPPGRLQAKDSIYTAALRALGEMRSEESYGRLRVVLRDFVPEWPVQRNYFPLAESGLGLEDIAYCNVVRCRTVANATPSQRLVDNCMNHFDEFVEAVEPRVVVFIGKWAHDRAAGRLGDIPHAFMNRMRSLSGEQRRQNREEVVALVKTATD